MNLNHKKNTIDFEPIIDYLKMRQPDILAIYAFGSRVHHQENTESDLDLAILLPKPASSTDVWEMMDALSRIIKCPIDLIDLRVASTVMQYQIINTGICVWEKSNEGRLFEVYVCNEKLELDARRSDLINDIQRTGRVYGR